MINTQVSVSVVTYTFNDHHLVEGLIASMECWSVRPKELIIVDDGSRESYVPRQPPPRDMGTQVIRQEVNAGPTRTKHLGLSAASSKFLLSIDADARIDDDWLERCLPLAAGKDVGMVSTPVSYESGDGPTARYLHLTYSDRRKAGETSFIPGPVFLMRRSVFAGVGGFSGYPDKIGEDDYLCRLLASRKFRLLLTDLSRARQIRRLSRTTVIRRGFTWQKNTFLREIDRGTPLMEVLSVFLHGVGRRPCMVQADDPWLTYHDLLYASYGILELSKQRPEASDMIKAALRACLSGYPRLHSQLERDLARCGLDLTPFGNPPAREFPPYVAVFPRHILVRLDDACSEEMGELPEDEDYSMYAGMGD
jgi:glycosyltransferase involved in cell wall biosynthesis